MPSENQLNPKPETCLNMLKDNHYADTPASCRYNTGDGNLSIYFLSNGLLRVRFRNVN